MRKQIFGWSLAALLVVLVTALSWTAFGQQTPPPPLVVSVIDVGQGDSILVQYPSGQVLLIDAGDRANGPKVVEYLRSRSVPSISLLVATQPHKDHIGGMAWLCWGRTISGRCGTAATITARRPSSNFTSSSS